ncbi:hypothetical protein QTP88_024285 [Uroleucon formosanum]
MSVFYTFLEVRLFPPTGQVPNAYISCTHAVPYTYVVFIHYDVPGAVAVLQYWCSVIVPNYTLIKKKKILHNKTFKSGGVDVSLPNVADPEDYFLGSPYATAV